MLQVANLLLGAVLHHGFPSSLPYYKVPVGTSLKQSYFGYIRKWLGNGLIKFSLCEVNGSNIELHLKRTADDVWS